MIGINYQKETPEYDAYLKRIQGRTLLDLKRLVNKGDISDKSECDRFINQYLDASHFYGFMNTPAVGLSTLITDIETKFPQLKDCRLNKDFRKTDPLYLFLHYHLVLHGYKKGFQEKNIDYIFPKNELIEAVNVDVCPYCNRMFIYSQKSAKKQKIVQAELDHFFSKDLFPYLAIAKYNLVPSCSCCNGIGAKFTTDAYMEKMINPYEIQCSDDYLKFRLKVKNVNLTSLEKLAEGLSLKMIALKSDMKSNIKVLNLEELYQHHTDYAAELYFKSLVKAAYVYRSSLKSILRKRGVLLTDDDIKRIIVGNFVTEKDYGKRPNAKMMHDVAEELGVI